MQRFNVHPVNPQQRLMQQAAQRLRSGGVVAMPTDASYVFCCALAEKSAVDQMRAMRGIDEKHLLTLMCRDLSELSTYAQVDNRQYRFLKEWTPGPYTFVLPATREVPRRLWHPSRKTLGLRVPDSAIVLALLESLGEPLLSTTLIPPDGSDPLCDPEDIEERFGSRLDLLLEGGPVSMESTTIIDMTGALPMIQRIGKGPVDRMGIERIDGDDDGDR